MDWLHQNGKGATNSMAGSYFASQGIDAPLQYTNAVSTDNTIQGPAPQTPGVTLR